ncbi:hypothetical protein ZIOFF_037716 [Zingiber officinale]|uniref:Uncharacterized protein n=1 Tax=Zingiber officinale TaxID=94328 RepID=A0A8J5L9Y5_ZINOF|nr:hypothetical protein ZIOFF_037716 [Zingiber officinale]
MKASRRLAGSTRGTGWRAFGWNRKDFPSQSLPLLSPCNGFRCSSPLAALSSLSLHPPSRRFHLFNTSHFSSSIRFHTVPKLAAAPRDDIDTSFFDNLDPNAKITFEPAAPPEGYVPPPAFDELPLESEEAIAADFEEIYGPAYSGESVIGNDIYVMDAKLKKASGILGRNKREKPNDGFEERVVQVRRVTKVVKGESSPLQPS